MAEVVYPAIPFNGGTVSMNANNSSMCRLTAGGRFVSVFAQYTPNAVIATVVDVTNPKTTTPTVTVVRQQVLTEHVNTATANQVRVWRLNDTTILIGSHLQSATNSLFDAYSVNASTGELTKLTSTSLSVTNLLPQMIAAGGSFELTDNHILMSTGASLTVNLARMTFNTSTNVLTYTNLDSLTVATNTYQRCGFARRPGTTDEATLAISSYNPAATAFVYAQVTRFYVVTPSAFTTYTPTIGNLSVYHRVGGLLSGTKAVFTDGSDYVEHELTTNTYKRNAAPNKFQGVTDSGSAHVAVDFVAINADYFGVISVAAPLSSATEPTGAVNQYLRIVKYTDANYAEASTGTANATKGMLIPATYWTYLDRPTLEQWGSDLLFQMCTKSVNEFSIRTIWF